MLRLGLNSLWHRRFTFLMTVVAVAVGIALILGMQRIRYEARTSFTDTVSGIDLIAAARGNPVQILMATVFGVGQTSNSMSWETYEAISTLPGIGWSVPIAQGDNHRGFPVIGTTTGYFEHFRYGRDKKLGFLKGAAFEADNTAVIGFEVSQQFGYDPGSTIVNAHGAGDVAIDVHDETPFQITGVLAPTGTPVDRMVFVPLEGFEALHKDRDGRAAEADPLHAHDDHAEEAAANTDRPYEKNAGRLNAAYLGLTSKSQILALQRQISEFDHEPLTALVPAMTLVELWSITRVAENALSVIAGAVILSTVLGMLTMVSATLDQRRGEFAILRSVGASPREIFGLIVLEAGIIMLAAAVAGLALVNISLGVAGPLLASRFGLQLTASLPTPGEWIVLLAIGITGLLASCIPAYRVYSQTVSDGMSLRQ